MDIHYEPKSLYEERKRLIFCTFYNKKTFLRLFNGAKDRAKVVDFRSSAGSDRRLFLSSQMSMSTWEAALGGNQPPKPLT